MLITENCKEGAIVKLKGGTCPKCASTQTAKEKIMGADTGDIKCMECGYTDNWSEFHRKSDKQKASDESI